MSQLLKTCQNKILKVYRKGKHSATEFKKKTDSSDSHQLCKSRQLHEGTVKKDIETEILLSKN